MGPALREKSSSLEGRRQTSLALSTVKEGGGIGLRQGLVSWGLCEEKRDAVWPLQALEHSVFSNGT